MQDLSTCTHARKTAARCNSLPSPDLPPICKPSARLPARGPVADAVLPLQVLRVRAVLDLVHGILNLARTAASQSASTIRVRPQSPKKATPEVVTTGGGPPAKRFFPWLLGISFRAVGFRDSVPEDTFRAALSRLRAVRGAPAHFPSMPANSSHPLHPPP